MKAGEVLYTSLYFLAGLFSLGSAYHLRRQERDAQMQNYKTPQLDNQSTRFCTFNQYMDEQEGRCMIVPGGGSVISIDNDARCEIETLRPHPTLPSSYYVCRKTKTILAVCTNGQRFEDRLKRCAIDANSNANVLSEIEDFSEAYSSTRLSTTARPPQMRRFRLLRTLLVCPLIKKFDPIFKSCSRWIGCDNDNESQAETSTINPEPQSVTNYPPDSVTKATPEAFTAVTNPTINLEEVSTLRPAIKNQKSAPIKPNVNAVTEKSYESIVTLGTTRGSSTVRETTMPSNKSDKNETTTLQNFTTNKPNTDNTVPLITSQETSQVERIITTKKWIFDSTPTVISSTTETSNPSDLVENVFKTRNSKLLTTGEFVATTETSVVEDAKTPGLAIPRTLTPEMKATEITSEETIPNYLLTTVGEWATTTSNILDGPIENIITSKIVDESTSGGEFLTSELSTERSIFGGNTNAVDDETQSVLSINVLSTIGRWESTTSNILENPIESVIITKIVNDDASEGELLISESTTRNINFNSNTDGNDDKTQSVDLTTVSSIIDESKATTIAEDNVENLITSTSVGGENFGGKTDADFNKPDSVDSTTVLSTRREWETTIYNIAESSFEDVLARRVVDDTKEKVYSTSELTTENSDPSGNSDANDGKTDSVELATVLSTISELETTPIANENVNDFISSTSSSSSNAGFVDSFDAISALPVSLTPPSERQIEDDTTTVGYDETTVVPISRYYDETSSSPDFDPTYRTTLTATEETSILPNYEPMIHTFNKEMPISSEFEPGTSTSVNQKSSSPEDELATHTSTEGTSISPENESTTSTTSKETSILPEYELTNRISTEETAFSPEYEPTTGTSVEETTFLPKYESATSTSTEETTFSSEYEPAAGTSTEETTFLPEYEPTTGTSVKETTFSPEYESATGTSTEETTFLPEYEPATGTSTEETTFSPEYEPATGTSTEETTFLPEYEPTTGTSVEETTFLPKYESATSTSTEETTFSSEYEPTTGTSVEETTFLPKYESATSTSVEETTFSSEYEPATGTSTEETTFLPEYEPTTGTSVEETTFSPEYEPATGISLEVTTFSPEYEPTTGTSVEETTFSSEYEPTTGTSVEETTFLPKYESATSTSVEETTFSSEYEPATGTSTEETTFLPEYEPTTGTSVEETTFSPEYEPATGISLEVTTFSPEYEPTTGTSVEETTFSPEYEPATGTSTEETTFLPEYEPTTGTSVEETTFSPEYEPATGISLEVTTFSPEYEPATGTPIEETTFLPEIEPATSTSTEETTFSPEYELTTRTSDEEPYILPEYEPTIRTSAEDSSIPSDNEPTTRIPTEETLLLAEDNSTPHRSSEQTSILPINEITTTHTFYEMNSITTENAPTTDTSASEESLIPSENDFTTVSNNSEANKTRTSSYTSIPFAELPKSTTQATEVDSEVEDYDTANTAPLNESIIPIVDLAIPATMYLSSESPDETANLETTSSTQSTTDESRRFSG